MSGIVLELQREALDKSVRSSDLLRKALLVARKLKVADLESWILSELNGYADNSTIPDYRWATGEIKAYNPYNGMWLPVMFRESNAEMHRSLTRRPCSQAIAEIENLVSQTKDGQLSMPYSAGIQAKLIAAADLPSPPVLIISEAKLHGILDAVRTAILDWALKLEENGIKGENLSFSEDDRKAASIIVFNIGSMSNSQIQAATTHSHQTLTNITNDTKNILELVLKTRASLPELKLDKVISDELRSELNTLEAQAKSPKPKTGVVIETLKSVRTILEGATGSMVAEGLIKIIQRGG
jgi:hypothetical protein